MRWSVLGGALVLVIAAALWAVPGTSSVFTAVVAQPGASTSTARYFTCSAAFTATAAGTTAAAAIQLKLTDAAASTTAVDSSGNGLNGTYSGTHTRPSDSATGGCKRDSSTAWLLDGSSSFVSTPALSTGMTVPFTVAVWVRPTTNSTAGGGMMTLCDVASASCTSRDDRLYLSSTGRPVFGTASPSSDLQTVRGPTAITDGLWHHVVGTMTTNAGMRLYVDGVDVTAASTVQLTPANSGGPSAAADPATFTATRATGTHWMVGVGDGTNWPYSVGVYFPGSITFAAAYRTGFTAAQVSRQWNAGR